MKPDERDPERLEDEKLEVARRFYMGSTATSPRSLGPTINDEAFMFLKKFFHRKKSKDAKPDAH